METRSLLRAFVERVVPRLKYPYLFLALLILFLIDVFVPDPIPFVDELALALLTFLLGSWRTRREAPPDEEQPPESAAPGLQTFSGETEPTEPPEG